MNQFILASHGELASGILDTATMILGDIPNLYAISMNRDDTVVIRKKAEALLNTFSSDDSVYIVTDLMGGSVNNEMLALIQENSALHLITGMNLPLILGLLTSEHPLEEDDIQMIIAEGRNGVVYCNELLKQYRIDEEEDLL